MTAQDRKKNSDNYLKKLNIPVNSHLPQIEEEDEVIIRSGQDIAKRILILTYLNVVGEGGDKNKIIDFLKKEELWDDVSGDEKDLLKKSKLTKKDKINLSWRSEGIWLMLWAINKVEHLDLPTTQCVINDILNRLPEFLAPPKEFFEAAIVRPAAAILDMSDLMYRIHWATRQGELDGKEIPANLEHSIVYERHYAINWITYYEENWDDVTTDT